MQIFGILNLTRDSFSDGGRYPDPARAIDHARRLAADGADVIDVGAQSTHPDAQQVDDDEQWRRLEPVITTLVAEGITVSVDTHRPVLMRRALHAGAAFINDVSGLADPQARAAVRDSTARLIVMHSCSAQARAQRLDVTPERIMERICAFFEARIAELSAAGIDRERLILDPGMGFFLSRNPATSLRVLRELGRLRALGLPLLVSTSRKSFIGAVLGDADGPRPVTERQAGTLASELWAALHGADYVRTHEPRPLRDARRVWRAISQA